MRSDVFTYVFKAWSLPIFIVFCAGLSLASPEPPDRAWVPVMYTLALVTDIIGFRLSRGCPCDGRLNSAEIFGAYCFFSFFVFLFALPLQGMDQELPLTEAEGGAFYGALILSFILTMFRLQVSGAEEYDPTSVSHVESRPSFAHWTGMLLLLLSAAAFWEGAILGCIKVLVHENRLWPWTLASAPLTKRVLAFVASAIFLILFTPLLAVLFVPQLVLVIKRVDPDDATTGGRFGKEAKDYFFIGLGPAADILINLAQTLFF